MAGCYLSIDFEDFAHDLQWSLGLQNPTGRPEALLCSLERITEVVRISPGSNQITFFSTAQIARDNGEILRGIANDGHEIGCHGYYHEHIFKMEQGNFASSLDSAIELIKHTSGQHPKGFRAPMFSIRPEDDWAYEELAQRFLYDSSVLTESRCRPCCDTDVKIFKNYELQEYPIFSIPFHPAFPNFKVRVIGGTYLRLLSVKMILKLMSLAVERKFIPLIYLHPYEFLYENEFWLYNRDLLEIPLRKRFYWQIRQNQWLRFGNRNVIPKLISILNVFPNKGKMISGLSG